MLDKLAITDFTPYIHQTFQIHLEGFEAIDLELVGVTEAGKASQPDVRNPFSLLFLGPVSPQYLLQHIYQLENPEMGALELFLVPLGFEDGRMQYEAIFT